MISSLLRAATSLYPFNTPRASLLDRLPNIPAGSGEIVGKNGMRYSDYHGDDPISRSLFWFGDFDPWVNHALRRLAIPGSNAIDIGANIGATAVTLAKSLGPNGRLFCFEPMPRNAEKLRNNLSANKLYWAEVKQLALSDTAATVHMSTPRNWAGLSRVVETAQADSIPVECVTFDEWASGHPDLRFSVCKIDVEGHEGRVFSGMQASLGRVASFVFERHNSNSSDPIMAMLLENGFDIFRIEKGMVKTYFRRLDSAPVARSTTDFAAVRADSAHLLG